MTDKPTEEDLAMLTDEERAALLDEEDADDEGDEGEGDEEDDGGEAGAEAGEAEEDAPGEDADDQANSSAEADASGVDKAAAGGDAVPEAKQPAPSQFPQFEAPADAESKLKEFETRLDELADKFDAGELTAREYREQSRTIQSEERELREAVLKASLSAEATRVAWETGVEAFLSEHKQYEPGSQLFRLLDAEVRHLQASADNQFDPRILKQAHENLAKVIGSAQAQPPAKQAKGERQKRELPPTLAHLPAADLEDAGEGEFAHLDRLDGTALEEALARMPEAQRERYLMQ